MVRLGQRLKEKRIEKGLTLDEVSTHTKIRVEFLQAIERGDYHKLPSAAYAHGFVANYSEYLGFSKKEAMALFRREFQEEKVFSLLPQGFSKKDFSVKRFRVRDMGIIALLVCIVLGYIIFQYRFLLFAPPLEITYPREGQILKDTDIVVLGKTLPSNTVFIEDISVPVDVNGEFRKELTVFPGKVTLKIKSQSRFGREAVVERHIEIKE